MKSNLTTKDTKHIGECRFLIEELRRWELQDFAIYNLQSQLFVSFVLFVVNNPLSRAMGRCAVRAAEMG